MKKSELISGLMLISSAYRYKFTKYEIDVWFEVFERDTFKDFRQKVILTIKENHFLPTIANVYEKRVIRMWSEIEAERDRDASI